MKVNYKLIGLLLFLPLLWVDNSAVFAQTAKIKIGSVAGYNGTRVTVPVNFDVSGSFKMNTLLTGKFHFNASKLKYRAVSMTPATITFPLGWTVVAWPTHIAGEVEFQLIGYNPLTYDGTLFYLHFDVVAPAAGEAMVSGDPDEWKIFSSTQQITEIQPGAVSYHIASGTSTVRGDANLDFKVDLSDVIAIIYHLYYSEPLYGQALENADADLDHNVDIWDVVQVNLYITFGHFNHNIQYIPTNSALVEFPNPVIADNSVVIPIAITNAANVISADVTFKYDPARISFEDFETSLVSEGYFVTAKEIAPGEAKLTYAAFSAATEDFTAGSIKLNIKDGANLAGAVVSSIYSINDGELTEGPSVPLTVTDVEDPNIIPAGFMVEQNYPNPFNPVTNISYSLPGAGEVSVKIYDMLGNEVKTLINETQAAGKHRVSWNGDNNAGQKITSGTYICRVTAAGNVKSMKMILMK